MPLQNRVTPEGEIVATPERGTLLGNRGGCFHRPDQTLLPRRYASKQWICCLLQFKGRRRVLRQPGLYTELFFLDEATAWAAGHRPCFECRRADAVRFAETWNAIAGLSDRAAAPDMDARLQAERIGRDGGKLVFVERLQNLPAGTMVRFLGRPLLVHDGGLLPWSFAGYGKPLTVAKQTRVDVLTPLATVEIMRAGYRPMVHASATTPAD